MQMSYVRVQMQSLFMMVPMHIFNRDVNVSLQRWRCKCLAVQMPFSRYVMMQMSPYGACHDANVHLRVCHDANVHVGMS